MRHSAARAAAIAGKGKGRQGQVEIMWIVALGIGSIVLFSTAVIVAALMMRNRWDDLGRRG